MGNVFSALYTETTNLETTPTKYDFSKVELHCHLDGCYRVETVAELGKQRGVKLPSYDPKVLREYITVSKPCSSLEEYIDKIAVASPAFAGDADALKRLTKETVQDKARDGTKYIELRYSPEYFANCDVTPILQAEEGRLRPRDVVEVINEAVKEAEYEYKIKVRTILCSITSYDWGREVAELCREFKGKGVVGFDIAGPETSDGFSPETIQNYEFCRQHGIHRTAHAGEVGPGIRVRKAVEVLHVERVGHGYHVVDDEEGYELAKNHVMHMEVCPLSSHFTSAVKGPWSSHPALRFFKDGVDFSLSTDDPGVHQYSILGDYDIATNEWGFTIKDIQNLNLNAAKASFLDETERRQLVSDLKREYDNFNRNLACND